MDFVGIDLHKTSSQICTLSDGGDLKERRIKTTKAAFDEVFAGRPRARILVEASTESEWVACHLEQLGHEVIVADPNFAPMYATRDESRELNGAAALPNPIMRRDLSVTTLSANRVLRQASSSRRRRVS
jgi:transposase